MAVTTLDRSSDVATHPWWQRGIVYQVYPWSLQDSNADGMGDIPGILSRLDHFEKLGVDALWVSPVYPSPMKDFGYDISDYCGVDPRFGTLQDLDQLIAEAHRRGIKLIMDFVPNHTSDQHPWFVESSSSRDNPKADWYMWRDPAPDGGPPNNWRSMFGGGGWQWCETRRQYYYHAFLKQQCDLNWRNPDVVAAMHDVLRFWLRRGIDGFRVDVIWHLLKDPEWRDNPPNPDWRPDEPEVRRILDTMTCDQPGIIDLVKGMRRVLDEFPDTVLIGELYLSIERLCAYYGDSLDGAQLPFNFRLLMDPWKADVVAGLIQQYETHLPKGAWPNWVLGNHDNGRVASRFGPAQARVAVMYLLTARGTPTIYYGDEIGLLSGIIPPDRVQDPQEKNEPGLPGHNRDIARTPMQWDASPFAGFSSVEPWLPIQPGYETRNVAAEEHDPDSMLWLHRRLIRLRRAHDALSIGDIKIVKVEGDFLAFERSWGSERFIVALNLGAKPIDTSLSEADGGRIVLSVNGGRDGEMLGTRLMLAGDDGLVIELG
ncbi:MAG: alpha-amylase family glycosyl hydrolase [Ancalomicrobiaceae bacterium]|nr:alpha-amylase family glycosyl hydrolase [Ancalomicrobiaceae bacterium]